MKILFIGGTGRLSKDVARFALESGNDVYLLTRMSEEKKIFVNEKYNMIYGDIRNESICKKNLENRKFDVVIDFLTYDIEQLKITLNIIENRYKQYIFISSATVYKKSEENEIISEYLTDIGNNKWKYAYDKYLCEMYIKNFFQDKIETYTIIRPYVTYGNTRVPYPIIPIDTSKEWTLIDRIINERPIPVFDNGNTVTTITHSEDFSKGVVGLMGNKLAYGEAFHITNNINTTWGSVLDSLGRILNRKVYKVNFSQEEIYDILPQYKDILTGDKGTTMVFDNTKICNAVDGFRCKVTLDAGLEDMVTFYNLNPIYKKIDLYWDGQIDYLCKSKGAMIKYNYKFLFFKDIVKYLQGRYLMIDLNIKKVKKLLRIIKGGKR